MIAQRRVNYLSSFLGDEMQRFDRLFSILLYLSGGRIVSAIDLARRLGVSKRTIYRDLETLSATGVPVYAERGRLGGIRLLEGYFLPPLMFTREEATALLLGLTALRGLKAAPYAAEAETAARKLLAALPDPLRALLARLDRVLGVERTPADVFHPERTEAAAAPAPESETTTTFLQALLDGRSVRLTYRSPYRHRAIEALVQPLGLVWDRDRWYLVSRSTENPGQPRLWRADRVRGIAPDIAAAPAAPFDVRTLLDRAWLGEAMEEWRAQSPVELRVTSAQAALLQRDWYYSHAQFAPLPDGRVRVRFGEQDAAVVTALVRWLGPGAEVHEPVAWREVLSRDLEALLAAHNAPAGGARA
jgi:predicted DNA-binding transcriptional regulator YafY